MPKNKMDETISEILEEDETVVKKARKKSCLFRLLLIVTLLGTLLIAFIYLQQYFLDLEAEAIVRAAQTATALGKSKADDTDKNTPEPERANIPLEDTAEPQPTQTPDPILARTATIAVQLTNVAEFQQDQPGD